MTQMNRGFLAAQRGDTAGALRYFEEGGAILHALGGNASSLAIQLNAHGEVALRVGDLETATRDLTQALAQAEQGGVDGMVTRVRANRALLAGIEASRRGDRASAIRAFEEAVPLFERSADVPATDQLPFAHRLLAEARGQPMASDAPAAEPAGIDIAAAPARRRRWAWRRG